VEKGSATSLWKEGGSFCCSDVVVVVVLCKEVFNVFDGVSVVLCEDGWDVLQKYDWGIVDGCSL
jgi:hypothetical protein